MKNLNKKIILVSVLILIFIGILFLISHKANAPEIQSAPENQNNSNTPLPHLPLTKGEEKGGGQTTLQINGVSYKDEITKPTNVYDFMSQLRSEGKINFTEVNYTGMGKFINEINGVKNSNSQSWIYYVDGIEAQIGISNYKINPGDVVSWKYEKSNY